MTTISRISPYSTQYRFNNKPAISAKSTPTAPETRVSYASVPYYPAFKSEYTNYGRSLGTENVMQHIALKMDEEALDALLDNDEKYIDPNYFSEKHQATLLTLLSEKIKEFSKDKKKSAGYINIANLVIRHMDFNPNLVLPLKSNLTGQHDTYLFEYVANNGQLKLLQQILKHRKFDIDKAELLHIAERLTTYGKDNQKECAKILESKANEIRVSTYRKADKSVGSDMPEDLKGFLVDTKSICPNGFADIGGMDDIKEEAREFMINPWSDNFRKKIIENKIKMPNGFLMYGPPGCGKTFISAAIAREMDIPMYEVDMSEIGSKWAYETENKLGDIFRALEANYRTTKKPSILLLDEIDAVCGRRDATNTDYLRAETSTILKLLNNAGDRGIILIATTNLLENVDPAALRTGRFDKKMEIKKPNDKEREAIFRTLASTRPMASGIDAMFSTLVERTENFTCSDISAVFHQAMRSAVYNNQDFTTLKNFEDAIKKIGSSIDVATKAVKGANYTGNHIGFNPQDKK